MNDERAERFSVQPLVGLVLGAIAGVINPGLFYFPFLTWIIPALIAGGLSISPRTRPVAVGFAAASLAWLAFCLAFYVAAAVAGFSR